MPRKIPTHRPAGSATKAEIQRGYDRGRRDDEATAFYHSAAWRKVREMKLNRDPWCERCPGLAGRLATIVHHKIERSVRPDLALVLDNLESLCAPCHNRHHKVSHDR